MSDQILDLLREQRDSLIALDLERTVAIRAALERYEHSLRAASIQTLRAALGLSADTHDTVAAAKSLLALVSALPELRQALAAPVRATVVEAPPVDGPTIEEPPPAMIPAALAVESTKPVTTAPRPIMPRERRPRMLPPPREKPAPIEPRVIIPEAVQQDFPILRTFLEGKKVLVTAGLEDTGQKKKIELLTGANVTWVDGRNQIRTVQHTAESIKKNSYGIVLIGVAYLPHHVHTQLANACKLSKTHFTTRGKLTPHALLSAMQYLEQQVSHVGS